MTSQVDEGMWIHLSGSGANGLIHSFSLLFWSVKMQILFVSNTPIILWQKRSKMLKHVVFSLLSHLLGNLFVIKDVSIDKVS